MIAKLMRRWRWLQLRLAGAKINYDIQIHDTLFRGNASGFTCACNAYFSDGARILIGSHQGKSGILTIGAHFFVNFYTIIDCHYSITIGKGVQIGPHCYISDFDHDFRTGITNIAQEGVARPIVIEDDAWIGAGVIILKGVTIGKGAVVGAGSVVTKDVSAHSVVIGNPVRLLNMRTLDK